MQPGFLTPAREPPYDRAVRLRAILVLVLALGGCASAPPPARTTTPAGDVAAREAAAQRRERERMRELQAALALAQAEARALRDELREQEAVARVQSTRIVHERPPEPIVAPPPEEEESGPRPVLRLYGPAPAPTPSVAAIPGPPAPPLAPPPPAASLRLPVDERARLAPDQGVPRIPEAPIVVAPPARAEPPAPRPVPPRDDAVDAYRQALAHLSARRFDEALSGLDAFLRAYPGHAYAHNAMYWRGEIHYARRHYRRALAELTALVERYPRGNKVPEALLKIGHCHARMGDRARARQVFERLRAEHPTSVAARMVPEEDV